jgi:uncharacterized protein YwgA
MVIKMAYWPTSGELNYWQKQLKSFLDQNRIDSSISNMSQIQKAVYDAKCNGEDLGYMFGEYPRGVFSPELRNDVERLNGVRYWDPAD